MSMLADYQIRRLSLNKSMIDPYAAHTTGKGILSYGQDSYGYTMRLSEEFMVLFGCTKVIDPKEINKDMWEKHTAKSMIIPPHDFILGFSLEHFIMPANVLGICIGKSTYARCGVIANVTPLEPDWKGRLVIEISNTTNCPVKIYANEGIAQIIFHISSAYCDNTYNGKYQDQDKLELPKV